MTQTRYSERMKILLSNDDSVYAPGIEALYKELKKFADVTVVAPLEEKSTTGHSLTIHKPLRLVKIKKDFYGVSGSPADCVYMGLRIVMKEKPDWVLSGINRGSNLGQDVYYSGTVSAAREACILGIPSLAVSLSIQFNSKKQDESFYFDTGAKVAVKTLKKLDSLDLAPYAFYNLNVPDVPMAKIKGIAAARQGFRYYNGNILKRTDHRGRDYFWVGGEYKGFRREIDTDCDHVENGFASLTPLQLDTTQFAALAHLERVFHPMIQRSDATKKISKKTGR